MLAAPLVEVNWLGSGEIAVITAAGLVLSHFVYARQTIAFVPAWLPFPAAWAYLGGAAHIAAGLGVLFGIVPRPAAMLEAAMLGVFTLLVWVPAVVAAPTSQLQWTGLLMSWTIAAGAWVVAGSLTTKAALEQRPAKGEDVVIRAAG